MHGEEAPSAPKRERAPHWAAHDRLGNRALLQLLRAMPYPHQTEVERSFGTAIRGRAVLDPAACHDRGVPAFTDGDVSHFAVDDPPREVAAHEAAHLAQHAGATRDGGFGAEGHAAAVASAVADGEPARGLLGPAGAAVADGVHDFVKYSTKKQAKTGQWQAGVNLRVSDDGRMAVEVGGKHAWAEKDVIVRSSKALEGVGSDLRLHYGCVPLVGPDVDGNPHTLVPAVPENVKEGGSGADMKMWQACISAAREVVGSEYDEQQGLTAVYKKKHSWLHEMFGFDPDEKEGSYTHYTAASDPIQMSEEIHAHTKGLSDQQAGINQYADPKVGQAFSIAHAPGDKLGANDYPYHVAGVVMKSGGDYVTVEAFRPEMDIHGPHLTNKWNFDMYGTEKDETFYEEWKDQYGPNATAMVVEKK